jgi:hypothetical protein
MVALSFTLHRYLVHQANLSDFSGSLVCGTLEERVGLEPAMHYRSCQGPRLRWRGHRTGGFYCLEVQRNDSLYAVTGYRYKNTVVMVKLRRLFCYHSVHKYEQLSNRR